MDIVVSFAFTYDAKCNFGVCLTYIFVRQIFASDFGGVQTPKTPLSYGLIPHARWAISY